MKMAVKKPIRRKRTRGRNFAGMMKAIWSNRWTGTSGMSVAVAFVALVGILTLAYSASTPPGEESSAHLAERPVAPHAATPVAAAPKESPAAPVTREPVETDPEPDGVTTGPMPTVVTLTGCLARSDNEFRLKDTTGLNAPKSRSWKSGFLTKRSASISIVPASGELPLSKHVGERITVSGTLIDREMKVRTLRRVSSSCDEPTPGRITA
jgi:hypothetical protein